MSDEVFFQVRYTVTVGERDDLLRDLAQLRMAESSRAEQGCLQYEYLLPVDAPDQVLFSEKPKRHPITLKEPYSRSTKNPKKNKFP